MRYTSIGTSGLSGDQLVGLHSTPLQLAFDRGLPALLCWLWLMLVFWLTTVRAEQQVRDTGDTNSYGLLLGASGAIAGFFASSLVNYNFGDAEVAPRVLVADGNCSCART